MVWSPLQSTRCEAVCWDRLSSTARWGWFTLSLSMSGLSGIGTFLKFSWMLGWRELGQSVFARNVNQKVDGNRWREKKSKFVVNDIPRADSLRSATEAIIARMHLDFVPMVSYLHLLLATCNYHPYSFSTARDENELDDCIKCGKIGKWRKFPCEKCALSESRRMMRLMKDSEKNQGCTSQEFNPDPVTVLACTTCRI